MAKFHKTFTVSSSLNLNLRLVIPIIKQCYQPIKIHNCLCNTQKQEHLDNTQQQQNNFQATTKISEAVNRSLNNAIMKCMLVIYILGRILYPATASPVYTDSTSLEQFQSGRNIRHLPCIVRKSGRSGVCMFAIDCIKQNGTHLGTCIDRFYFGSCCDINQDDSLYAADIGDNSIDQNTISHNSGTLGINSALPADIKSTNIYSSSSKIGAVLYAGDVTQMISNVTTSVTSVTAVNNDKLTSTSSSTGGISKPSKPTPNNTPSTTLIAAPTTKRPLQTTTRKNSHFVIRTTSRPTATTKPPKTTTLKSTTQTTTSNKIISTTIKTTTNPTTTTTTTIKPIKPILSTLTTTSSPTLTTPHNKIILPELNLTNAATTHPNIFTTYQIVETTLMPFVESYVNLDSDKTEANITSSSGSNSVSKPIVTTTPKAKLQTTRKPPNTKKPISTKRPKPTRKPSPLIENVVKPLLPEQASTASSIEMGTTTEHKYSQTTKLRPKPTTPAIKVSKPTPPSQDSPLMGFINVTKLNDSFSASISTTTLPIIPLKTNTSTSTSVTTAPGTFITHIYKQPPLVVTTLRPGLVTWSNIQEEPGDSKMNSTINGIQTTQISSGWIPVSTIAPLMALNENKPNRPLDTTTPTTTSSDPLNTTVDVTMSSSVNGSITNMTMMMIPPPKKPITLFPSPATSNVTEKNTTRITTTTTTTTITPETSSLLSNQPDNLSTTEGPISTSSIKPDVITLENISTDYNEINLTTTSVPDISLNTLEGIDYRQVCGRRMFPEPRIVGGSNAAFGRWPWQISLRQWRTSTYLHKCGAALLNENWAVTAAHCVDNVPPSDLLLRLGEYDLAEEEEPYGYQERRVQIVASHPQFDPRTFEYDLALLRFYEPVQFQPNIIPVCVPESDENFIGQTAFVTGWGRLYEDGPLPSVLQEVAVPVINNTICESMYRTAGYIEHIPHIFICAGWKKGGYDSCEGDSGGPMVLQRESDKRFHLGGVISWGIGCAEANQPGVYTRISEFRDWINQILQF